MPCMFSDSLDSIFYNWNCRVNFIFLIRTIPVFNKYLYHKKQYCLCKKNSKNARIAYSKL